LANDTRFDTIAMQHRAHFVGRQKDIRRTIVSLHKAMTITVTRDGASKLFQ
jgi:hypothetical protein